MNNPAFGKTIENVKKHRDIKPVWLLAWLCKTKIYL